jgi:hypothetical protein
MPLGPFLESCRAPYVSFCEKLMARAIQFPLPPEKHPKEAQERFTEQVWREGEKKKEASKEVVLFPSLIFCFV